MPAISVLMPVYNAERYVAEAVRSILAQTLGDFEFLIVDDGSTDGSLAVLKRFADEDPRVRLISRANTGLVIALNEMIGLGRGRYLARMDADDVSEPTRFEKQVRFLESHPDHAVVGSRVLLIDPDGGPLMQFRFESTHEEIDTIHIDGSCTGSVICHPTAMMRRDAVVAAGGYRPEAYLAEDADLFLRLAERGRIANYPEALLRYRVHAGSISHARRAEQLRVLARVVAEARHRRGLPPCTAPAAEEPRLDRTCDRECRWAWWALRGGNVGTARKHAWRAFCMAPWRTAHWKLLACSLRGH